MNFHDVVESTRNTFENGTTKPISFREKQLQALLQMYEENVYKLMGALLTDLRKDTTESELSELISIKEEIRLTLAHFKDWAKPETAAKSSFANILDSLKIYKDPYGVVLIIGSWNYPLRLIFLPLIGAIAAGNCVILKPSEIAPASSGLIAHLIPHYLDGDCYKVVTGGANETTELLKEKFDYIFFTGSSSVGKIVRTAANVHLTPTTLELGGKCPVFLHKSADIETAARRILWGKFFNAGQTCVAPDYLICSKEVEKQFLQAAAGILKEFYGENPKASRDLCRIISIHHFKRLRKLIETTKVVLGGDVDEDERYISPTILNGVEATDAIMEDEIFGPILPILNMETSAEAIKFINAREKPLALYVFSNDRSEIDAFLNNTSSGGVTVNDTLMHIAVGNLPFGGVGGSGMGAYQGKATFDTFAHKKSVLIKDLGFIGEKVGSLRYPPYDISRIKYLKVLLRQSHCKYSKYLPHILMFGLGAFVCCYAKYLSGQKRE